MRLSTALVLVLSAPLLACSEAEPAAGPGGKGGPCVSGDLCNHGLQCVGGKCQPGPWGIQGTGAAGAGGSSGAGGSAAQGGAGGVGGEASGGTSSGGASAGAPGGGGVGGVVTGGTSSGGAAGSGGVASGGTSATGGTTATGGTSATGGVTGTGGGGNCVGIPAVNGSCNAAFCYCSASDSCFPKALAQGCCSVAPSCK